LRDVGGGGYKNQLHSKTWCFQKRGAQKNSVGSKSRRPLSNWGGVGEIQNSWHSNPTEIQNIKDSYTIVQKPSTVQKPDTVQKHCTVWFKNLTWSKNCTWSKTWRGSKTWQKILKIIHLPSITLSFSSLDVAGDPSFRVDTVHIPFAFKGDSALRCERAKYLLVNKYGDILHVPLWK